MNDPIMFKERHVKEDGFKRIEWLVFHMTGEEPPRKEKIGTIVYFEDQASLGMTFQTRTDGLILDIQTLDKILTFMKNKQAHYHTI
jgi:hypothetical protein